jgi:hypothetical protein
MKVWGYSNSASFFFQRMKSKLSDQREPLAGGRAALPLYTCLHVKKNISAKIFQVEVMWLVLPANKLRQAILGM